MFLKMPLFLKAVILGLLASIVNACAIPRYNYIPIRTDISEPPLDSVNVAYVGDSLLRQGNYTENKVKMKTPSFTCQAVTLIVDVW